ncbi:hypothetical protein [Thalassovita sp.]|uniref:hypothetical protein n=1 Tax=Thalassovita sp. TaxID=1979401 RepID=UPI002B266EAB|nr:hypothetical protein [Thalassovita sp.]
MTKLPNSGGRHYRDPKTGKLTTTEPKPAPMPKPESEAQADNATVSKTIKKGR